MRALFETMPLAPGEDLLLIYRARSLADLLFREEIDQIAARRGARVAYLVGSRGHALTPAGLHRLVPDVAERDVSLCGSPRLTATVRASLRDLGLPATQLHEERFTF